MGALDRGPEDPQLFLAVRRIGVVALVAAAVVLVLVDAVSEPFHADPVVIGLLVSGALLFAGLRPLNR